MGESTATALIATDIRALRVNLVADRARLRMWRPSARSGSALSPGKTARKGLRKSVVQYAPPVSENGVDHDRRLRRCDPVRVLLRPVAALDAIEMSLRAEDQGPVDDRR